METKILRGTHKSYLLLSKIPFVLVIFKTKHEIYKRFNNNNVPVALASFLAETALVVLELQLVIHTIILESFLPRMNIADNWNGKFRLEVGIDEILIHKWFLHITGLLDLKMPP